MIKTAAVCIMQLLNSKALQGVLWDIRLRYDALHRSVAKLIVYHIWASCGHNNQTESTSVRRSELVGGTGLWALVDLFCVRPTRRFYFWSCVPCRSLSLSHTGTLQLKEYKRQGGFTKHAANENVKQQQKTGREEQKEEGWGKLVCEDNNWRIKASDK